MDQPTVLHLSGWSGTGKTRFLDEFSKANPGSIQILTPGDIGERFDPTLADYDHFAAVALDEVLMWERGSIQAGIATLEARATAAGRKLVLVTQGDNDLVDYGVVLRTPPFRIRLEGAMRAIGISYDGHEVRFGERQGG